MLSERKLNLIAGGLPASAVLMWIEPLLSGRIWCAMMVMPASLAIFTSGVTSIGWIASMASGESRPSRLLMKARIGEAGWLRKPLRFVM